MSKLIFIKKSDLSISQSPAVFYDRIEAQGLVVNPSSGRTASGTMELPFIIQSTPTSVPLIDAEFCSVSRVMVNMAEQHNDEKQATIAGNDSLQAPKKALKENVFFKELKGING